VIGCSVVVGCSVVWGRGLRTWARARAERGVSSAGFTTTVHPAASAAPTFLVIIALGKFHWGVTGRRNQRSNRLDDAK